MANEDKKDFNAMLMDSKDMPKVQIIAYIIHYNRNANFIFLDICISLYYTVLVTVIQLKQKRR